MTQLKKKLRYSVKKDKSYYKKAISNKYLLDEENYREYIKEKINFRKQNETNIFYNRQESPIID